MMLLPGSVQTTTWVIKSLIFTVSHFTRWRPIQHCFLFPQSGKSLGLFWLSFLDSIRFQLSRHPAHDYPPSAPHQPLCSGPVVSVLPTGSASVSHTLSILFAHLSPSPKFTAKPSLGNPIVIQQRKKCCLSWFKHNLERKVCVVH